MMKVKLTLFMFLILASAPVHAEYGPVDEPVVEYCEHPRIVAALQVLQNCKDVDGWAECVMAQEDPEARLAYLKVCKDPDGTGFQTLNPCDCLIQTIRHRDPECGSTIICEVEATEEPVVPTPPPNNQNNTPNVPNPAPQAETGSSGCSLGGMAAGFDGLAWLSAFGFLLPALIRRRA